MDVVVNVLRWIADNLVSQVPILIGLITLIGLLLQRKRFDEVISGTLRATVGMEILLLGSGVFTAGLASFQAIVSSAFKMTPPSATSSMNDFLDGRGSVVPLIIAVAFLLHLVMVRLFRGARYVYLTGHQLYWLSLLVAAALVEGFSSADSTALLLGGSIILACYLTLQPMWISPFMKKVVGHDNFGLAHTTSVMSVLASLVGRFLGDPEKDDAEKVKLPKWLSFLKDINVSTALIIGIIMLIAILFADPATVSAQIEATDPGMSVFAWTILQALKFAGGIAILLYGVRLFLAEIVPAFRGISQRAIPGSRPALDIPVTFPNKTVSVMIGFLSSTVVFLVLMVVFGAAGWFALVPPMIMLFFGGGAGGVFGNAFGGWRGAVFGGALNGLILAFGQWIAWGLLDTTAPQLATLADADWYVIVLILRGVAAVLAAIGATGSVGIWVTAGAVAVITVVVLVIIGRRVEPDQATVDKSHTTVAPARPAQEH